MVDAGSPDGVVAFLLKQERSDRQVKAEPALDEEENGGALFAGVPGVARLASWMRAPLDLDCLGCPAHRLSCRASGRSTSRDCPSRRWPRCQRASCPPSHLHLDRR
jgi:hypothetical protein